MMRPVTLPQSAALVAYGAYGARHALQPGAPLQLALSTLGTGAVTSSSMLINDLVDYQRGVDTAASQPNRPLVRGEVQPEAVEVLLQCTYLLVLVLMCWLASVRARLLLLAATLVTYLYTEHLKPLLFVKNAACAFVVASAPAFGAAAVSGQFRTAWRSSLVVFGMIFHREMVMDVGDRCGDAAAGLRTVATAFGARVALALSLAPLALALCLAPCRVPVILQGSAALITPRLAVHTAPLALGAALLCR